MKKVLIVLGAIAVVVIGLIVFVFGYAKAKLEPLAEQILVDCRDGKVDQVYAKASDAFRKDVALDDFRAYVAGRTRALGAFRKVGKTTGGGMSSSTGAGTVGNVSLDLEYEKGPATGEFEFVKENDEWRLLRMKVAFDEKLVPAPDRNELEARSRALLGLYDQSAFVELYARFSKPLQDAWKAEAYEPQIRDLREKAGSVQEAKLRDVKDEADGKVRATFDVRFENGPGTAAFGWVAQGGEWHLTAFDLHLGAR